MKGIILLVLLGINLSMAQEIPVLITDRPDQTESPAVVPKNSFQLETGLIYEEVEDEIKQKNFTYNTSLLRFGLMEMLELRLGIDLLQSKLQNFENRKGGFTPLLLGVKISLVDEKKWIPSIAILGHTRLSFTASENLKRDNPGADFRFAFSHTLNEKNSLSYNLGLDWNGIDAAPYYLYTLVYGRAVTEKFSVFTEVYGNLIKAGSPMHSWNAGMTYLLNPNFQLDAYAGRGFKNEQKFLFGAGASIRLPK